DLSAVLVLVLLGTVVYFFFQAEDGIRDRNVTGVQTCALPISRAVVNDTTPAPKGESMADESGVMLPGSREEMRFLRKNSNWVNMIIAILACLAVVVGILFIALHSEVDSERVVDYQGIAEQSEGNADFDLIVPQIPRGWSANEASLDRFNDSEYVSWYMSFIGSEDQWVSIEQAKASQNWAKKNTEGAAAAETLT